MVDIVEQTSGELVIIMPHHILVSGSLNAEITDNNDLKTAILTHFLE